MKIYQRILVVIGIILLAGCATTYDLKVNPSKISNNGEPFYIFVKNNSRSNYLASNYQTVYDDYADNKIIQKILVNPKLGEQSWPINRVSKNGVSLYFLFQEIPGSGSWKLYIPAKDQNDITVKVLKNDNIQTQS